MCDAAAGHLSGKLMTERRILVTSALPYANGHIHIGHLVEYIQTDIWVRFQKLRGHRCVYMCADDTHGTAIMIRARREGRTEEEVIADMQKAHVADFAKFDIEFDNYGSTNSDENRILCEEFWQAVNDAGLVTEREIEQFYDPDAETFLADRFVKGTCPNPKCGATDQNGDACEKCLMTYSPEDLIDPYSTLSGGKPELRKAPHKYIQLEKLHGFLDEWVGSGEHLEPEVANYLKGQFLSDELRDWDVTRPPKYFGFEVPGFPGHSWYVWFDAPIGYLASTRQWCDRTGEDFDQWWKNPDTEIHHFIGKDITYFHTLFWPGMLKTAGYNLPDRVHIHGFLTVNGEKMSKSKGTFVMASTYANHLPPEAIRYYYASKLGPGLDDLDLEAAEFVAKFNADLVGKVVNLASRSAKFVSEQSLSESYPDDGGLFVAAAEKGEVIAEAYERGNYNGAMREILLLANAANEYIDRMEPWVLRKDPEKAEEVRKICTVALNLFRQITLYLSPVLPQLAKQTGELLNNPIERWDQSQTPLTGTPVSKFQHLMKRIDEKQVQAMVEESKEDNAADAAPAGDSAEAAAPAEPDFHPADTWKDSGAALEAEPMSEECTIDDFFKVDLRVARIIEATHVEGADKLLGLTLSLGGGETRNVFAGIKAAYEPEKLVGRLVICVANLKPRKMKFGLSEGMVCASGPGKSEVFLLSPDEGAVPGQRVH